MKSAPLVCAIALAALLASPALALAFTGDNHKDLTAAAFRVLADPQTVEELRAVSIIGDSTAYEPLAPGMPWFLSAAHFDNCAWSEGSTWIKDHRRAAVSEAYADAILAVQDQLDRFVAELRAGAPMRADAILARLGLRPQARVISEALAWPTGKIYFFQGSAYSRYDLGLDHVDPDYPRDTASNWPGLGGVVDAALVAPGGAKAYFFRGASYSRYDVAADHVDSGFPLDIGTYWHGLWGSGLDAAVLWPNGKIYFFRGTSYVRYDFEDDQVDTGYPLPIAGQWRGLEPFSSGIDAVFVTPNGQKAYFFRGDHYIRYDVALDRADPGYPLRIEDHWHGM